ncbi:MAG: hypothetical protein ACI9LD_001859 [Polaromonas sp.]|jgi:hypothetical protein
MNFFRARKLPGVDLDNAPFKSCLMSLSALPVATAYRSTYPHICLTRCTLFSAPRAFILRSTASTSCGPMVDMGILPMWGITSFSRRVVILLCVLAMRSAAVFASHSRVFSRRCQALASETAGYTPKVIVFCWSAKRHFKIDTCELPTKVLSNLCKSMVEGEAA